MNFESNETIASSNAFNTSDAESNQFDHLHQKTANGTEITHAKDSKQVAASANAKSSLDTSMSAVDAKGNKVDKTSSQAADSHDAISASSDVDAKIVKHADRSESISNDSSNQTASEHNDSSKQSEHEKRQNADGSFSDVSSNSAKKNAVKDATDVRQNAFANVDAAGNSVSEVKNSLVENHSNDSVSCAPSID